MPEYFKFCPKCGRVLNREWCTHCEPEKEEAYRREQMKKYQIEGDYMSDKGIGLDVHGLFGSIGSGIDHTFKKQDKEQTYEYSYRDQEQFEKKEKKAKKVHQAQSVGRSVKKVSIITLLSCILGFLVAIKALLGFVDLSDFSLPSAIESFFDVDDDGSGDIETIEDTSYSDYSNQLAEDTEDIGDSQDFDSEYYFLYDLYVTDSWTAGDEERSASIQKYILKDSEDNNASGGAADLINSQYKVFTETADYAKQQKLAVDYTADSYITYRDDSYANLILSENTYNGDTGIDSNFSYFFSMDTLEVVNIEKQLTDKDIKASQFADSIAETISNNTEEVTADSVKNILADKTYYYCVNEDGNIYIAVPYDGQYFNTQLQIDDEPVNIYDYLDI